MHRIVPLCRVRPVRHQSLPSTGVRCQVGLSRQRSSTSSVAGITSTSRADFSSFGSSGRASGPDVACKRPSNLPVQLGPECGRGRGSADPFRDRPDPWGAQVGATARQSLLAAGKDPDSKVRIAALQSVVCRIGDETASSELARILSSDMDSGCASSRPRRGLAKCRRSPRGNGPWNGTRRSGSGHAVRGHGESDEDFGRGLRARCPVVEAVCARTDAGARREECCAAGPGFLLAVCVQ